jgi:ribosomal protein L21E
MPMFEIKENERVFKEAYLTNENVEIYIDSDFNFDRNKIFELILNKMAKGGTTTRQQAKIGYTMREFKEGKLKTSYGETVTDEKQALAIALSKAGIEKKEYGGMIEIGLQGFYNGKKRLPITVTKTNAKNIYFRNEETGEIKRSERKNFERLFESGSSTNVMPIIDDTPSFKLDDIKADDVTKKGSAIPSTISAVWDKEYIVGDRVRIRIDFTTDSTTNTRDYAGIGSYFTNKNDFKIVSKLSDNSMKRPQNPTGILYTLNNGQNWEGKDLEPFDLSSQTGMPKKQKKDSAKDDSAKVDYYAMFKQNNKVIEMSNNETLAIQLGRFITMVGEDKLMTIENVQDFKSAIDKLG